MILISNIIFMSWGRWVSLEEALNSNLGQQEKVIMGNIFKKSMLNVETNYPSLIMPGLVSNK